MQYAILLLTFLSSTMVQAYSPDTSGSFWERSTPKATTSYEKSTDMLDERRMGVGMMFAGTMGYAGVQWQLNFSQDFGMTLGYGFSRGFNAFNLDFRKYLGSGSFTPFYGGGYVNWSGHGDAANRTSPQFLSDDFLDQNERVTGDFSEHLAYPSLGLQYNNLSGEWAGLSFLVQLVYLVDIQDFVAKPTAGLGSIYYF